MFTNEFAKTKYVRNSEKSISPNDQNNGTYAQFHHAPTKHTYSMEEQQKKIKIHIIFDAPYLLISVFPWQTVNMVEEVNLLEAIRRKIKQCDDAMKFVR